MTIAPHYRSRTASSWLHEILQGSSQNMVRFIDCLLYETEKFCHELELSLRAL